MSNYTLSTRPSYACNGINLKDVAALKWCNIDEDRIVFVRQKTRLTTKADQHEIVAYRNEFINLILTKYGAATKAENQYVFEIINDGMSAHDAFRAVKMLIRFVNQHMKNLAETVGITEKISYNWARHSFTANAIRSGATMEMVQESLGHQNIKTTQNYCAGFDDLAKKSITDKLMDFS